MKKIVKISLIEEKTLKIDETLKSISALKEELLNLMKDLDNTNVSININKLLERMNSNIAVLDNIINTIGYYTNYVHQVMNFYDSTSSDYKRILLNALNTKEKK